MATTKFAIAPMKAAQIPGARLEPISRFVEREIPKPNAGQVLINAVQALRYFAIVTCFTKEGAFFGLEFSILASPGTRSGRHRP